MITDSDFNVLAQKAHFLGGACAVLLSEVAFQNPLYGFGALTAFAVVKEFWYDYRYETAEVRGSSAEDFAFYLFGALSAAAVIWLVK